MTGKYIDFKGKLKVGDRVRVNSEEACTITSVDDRGFGYRCGDTDFYKVWGTLELLSPSPRVVTLETLEPGDEVSSGSQFFYTVLHKITDNIVILSEWYERENESSILARSYGSTVTVAQMVDNKWQPIQPASPPAPAEKEEEWWEDGKYWEFDVDDEGMGMNVALHLDMIAEAKRMGAEEAWKEMKAMVQAGGEACEDVPRKIGWWDVRNRIRAKLESLNKPAGAGEK